MGGKGESNIDAEWDSDHYLRFLAKDHVRLSRPNRNSWSLASRRLASADLTFDWSIGTPHGGSADGDPHTLGIMPTQQLPFSPLSHSQRIFSDHMTPCTQWLEPPTSVAANTFPDMARTLGLRFTIEAHG